MKIYNSSGVTLTVISFVLLGIFFLLSNVYAKEYVNEEFGIKFEYPDEWKLTTANENLSSFHAEDDEKLLANFHADPDPSIFNFVAVAAYTNMTNLHEFLEAFKKELNTNKKANIEVLDIKKYTNVRGQPTILIKTIYTPIQTKSPSDFASSSSNEVTYILFYEDKTGYKITYSLPTDIAYKYQDDVLSIVSQIRDNKM
ncbi:MAG TPA: hypothetical protein VJU85_01960 [Nitrososphaeraceae archaeon]|nr:hypothetical protein [Nitrososphaeraceae archaeon]